MTPRSRSRRRCSRSAASASTRRSCSPTFSSSPTRSASACRFESGDGPRLDPIGDAEGAREAARRAGLGAGSRRCSRRSIASRLALPEETALIGFCGAPWTVASYMIAGRGTPDQAPARLFAYRHPDLFARLIDRLVDASAEYLRRQFAAGADAAQIFNSWAGVLPPAEFDRWCVAPIAAIAAKVRAGSPGARLIAFPRGAANAARQIRAPWLTSTRSASTPPPTPEPPSPLCPSGSRSRAISIRWRWSRADGASTRRSSGCWSGFAEPRPYLQSRSRRLARDADRACRAPGRAGARRTSSMNDLSQLSRRPAPRSRARLVRDSAGADHRGDGGARARVLGRRRGSSAGPFRARALGAHRRQRRARRRRADGDAARAPVREDGRALFRSFTAPFRPEFAVANSRRRQRPALLGRRRLGDRPSVEPACADRAHEHAARAHHQNLVRRRRRSDADAR